MRFVILIFVFAHWMRRSKILSDVDLLWLARNPFESLMYHIVQYLYSTVCGEYVGTVCAQLRIAAGDRSVRHKGKKKYLIRLITFQQGWEEDVLLWYFIFSLG